MENYNKIVRNNMPNILEGLSEKFYKEQLNSCKELDFLYMNLISTIYNSFEDKSLDHISKAMDLLMKIAKEYGYSEQNIIDQRNK